MAVKGLIHYALEVPDPVVGQEFYRDFGLVDGAARRNAIELKTRQGHGELLLFEGPSKRLHHVAFAAPGDEYAAVQESLTRAGVRLVDPPRDALDLGIWFFDPDGNLVNVRDEPPPSLPQSESGPRFNYPGNAQRIGERAAPPPFERATPRRLGHVLFFTPDPDRACDFYAGVLGFKISDRVPGLLAFTRCSTDHHNLAFAKSTHRGFHHASYEVGSIDEIGMGGMSMTERGWKPAWGVGRHVIGSNYFWYMNDPWGSYAEYFHDIDYIPEEMEWEVRNWDPKHALYCWGPDVPADFIVNKEQPATAG